MVGVKPKILVTGATGYVGGRLVPRLLKHGYDVRCLARNPSHLKGRGWKDVEIVQGDALDAASLERVLDGIDVVYYLIHSLLVGVKGFENRDRVVAAKFTDVAKRSGVKRIIYLGGLGTDENKLSPHLYSRHEVGRILRLSGIPVTEFRAAVIVGSGSISFEIIRYLTERIPILVGPRSLKTKCQPIAIADVLSYLIAALEEPQSASHVIDIGGADILRYKDLISTYAKVRQLKRLIFPLPGLSPGYAARWIGVFTPVPSAFAHTLMQGMKNEVICRNQLAHQIFPQIEPIGYEAAVRLALERTLEGKVETIWSHSPDLIDPDHAYAHGLTTREGMIMETNQEEIDAPPHSVFKVFTSLGGERGWLYANWAWRLRAAMDRLVGGLGMRRGRRNPNEVLPGDVVDFWRAEIVEPDHLLRLCAEMKLPGRGWLQFEVVPEEGKPKSSVLTQTVFFETKGLMGHLYWWLLYPFHVMIFSGMCKRIKKISEEAQ
jgi:uncharacterized protein YbjT (DUF2867 family)/uncharacterized protein YndB with AHSA1/START domain